MKKHVPTFRLTLSSGKGKMSSVEKQRYLRYTSTLKDGVYLLSLRRYFKGRTNPQNAYMWAVVYGLISAHTGYEPEEVHDMCLATFSTNTVEIETKDGVMEMQTVKRSSAMTTMEFSDYLERVKRWASQELGLYIPDPNEVDYG